jgi:hypothetical protein
MPLEVKAEENYVNRSSYSLGHIVVKLGRGPGLVLEFWDFIDSITTADCRKGERVWKAPQGASYPVSFYVGK